MKRYDDNTPIENQYPCDLSFSVMPFSVPETKIIVASEDATIKHKPRRDTSKPAKTEKPAYIPLLTKKPAKRIIAKSTGIKAFYTNGNDSSYNGRITPIDAGMNAIATIAGNERDNCPSHKSKRIR
jgi:hypothetical protein